MHEYVSAKVRKVIDGGAANQEAELTATTEALLNWSSFPRQILVLLTAADQVTEAREIK